MKKRIRTCSALLALLFLTSAVGCTTADEGTVTTSPTTEAADPATDAATDPATDAATDAATGAVTDAATEAATAPETETEPQGPVLRMTVDETFTIVLADDADELTRGAAELMAAAFKDRAGLELPVSTVGQGEHGIRLIIAPSEEGRDFALYLSEAGILYLTATDSTTLYFAVEAIMEAWLDPAANLVTEDGVLLYDETFLMLASVTTRLDNSIRILSQNIRYSDDPNGNSVNQRAIRFRRLLEEYVPDIFGTQEFTNNWDIWLNRMFKAAAEEGTLPTYESVGCSRDGRTTKGGEFNKIFYRADRFELVESDTFWLSDTPDKVSHVEGSLCDRICTWALLKDRNTGRTILVANTHLDHGTDDVRAIQAEILMAHLTRMVGDYPVCLTGDFNSGSYDEAYATVSASLQDAHKTAWTNGSTVSHTYHGYSEWGSEIDYIFHNDKATAVYYEIVSTSYEGFVSDHYGVIADFVY